MALKRISGLWLKSGKRGSYMTGGTTEPIPAGAKLLVFKNDRKQSDNDPDYTLHLATDDDGGDQQPRQQSADNPFRNRSNQNAGGQHVSPATDGEPLAMRPPLNATADELAGVDVPF